GWEPGGDVRIDQHCLGGEEPWKPSKGKGDALACCCTGFVLCCRPAPMPTARKTSPGRRTTVRHLRDPVLRVARSYGTHDVRIFGAFARGEQRETSDVDLLVELPAGMSLLDLAGLKLDLEAALRRNVDVVPTRSLKPALRERILAEARPL